MNASILQLITMPGPLSLYTSGEVSCDAIVWACLEAVGGGNGIGESFAGSLRRSGLENLT